MNIYLDIETIPDQTPGALDRIKTTVRPPAQYKKEDSIREWLAANLDSEADNQWRRTALDGGQGEIVVIGLALDDGPVQTFSREPGQPEIDILVAFGLYVQLALADGHHHDQQLRYVGHNVGFDLGFLYKRHVVNRIKPAVPLFHDRRIPSEHVTCTMTAWAGYGNRISLDDLCRQLGIRSPKDSMGGSQVWDAVQAGRLAEVAAYCARDVEAVRQVHRRLRFLDLEVAA